MKWFFALNQNAPHFGSYLQLARVAAFTARRQGGLEPHMLYHGTEDDRLAPLRTLGVTILPCDSFLLDDLRELDRTTANQNILWYGPGVYLRAEIPALALRHGWSDEHALYTDCDVFFTESFSTVEMPKPERYFSVSAEGDPKNFRLFNSGVMVMHLPSLQEVDTDFRAFLRAELPQSVLADWDQYSYRRYFAKKYSRLPVEYNWKPYWNENLEARIIHFHGPKPFSRSVLQSGHAPASHIPLATPYFWRLCEEWDELLAESERAVGR